MQLKYLSSIVIFLFGILLSTAAFSSPASSAKLTWTSLSETDMLIDVTLPSGVEVRGVRYRKQWDGLLLTPPASMCQNGE